MKRAIKLLVLSAVILAVFVTSSMMVYTATLSEIEQEIKNAQNQQNSIDGQLNSLEDKKQAAEEELNKVSDKLSSLEQQKQNAMSDKDKLISDIEEIYDSILAIQSSVEAAEQEYQKMAELFLIRAKTMYQYSARYNVLDLLMESRNVLDFMDRVNCYTTLLDRDKQLIEDMRLLKQELLHKKDIADVELADTEAILAEKQALIEKIQNSEEIVQSDYQASKDAVKKLEEEEKRLEEESKRIEKMLEDLQKQAAESEYDGGKMLWPAEKGTRISSYYGYRIHPISGQYKMHSGIDIPASGGTNILAAASGTVITATYNSGGYGYYIIVDHGGGICTLYAHSSKLLVKVGDKVNRGDVIALVGTTGASTGNHLHFEVRVNGKTTDPLDYLNFKK